MFGKVSLKNKGIEREFSKQKKRGSKESANKNHQTFFAHLAIELKTVLKRAEKELRKKDLKILKSKRGNLKNGKLI